MCISHTHKVTPARPWQVTRRGDALVISPQAGISCRGASHTSTPRRVFNPDVRVADACVPRQRRMAVSMGQ
jgi:hypothetical protein